MSQETTVRDLEEEQVRVKELLSRQEEQQEVLLSQRLSAAEEHREQVLQLEQVPTLTPDP